MAFCKQCGGQVDDNAAVCPACGASTNAATEDKGGVIWGILGFFIPIAGFVLWLLWRNSKPKSAKAAGIGTLISVILSVVYYVLMFALGLGL